MNWKYGLKYDYENGHEAGRTARVIWLVYGAIFLLWVIAAVCLRDIMLLTLSSWFVIVIPLIILVVTFRMIQRHQLKKEYDKTMRLNQKKQCVIIDANIITSSRYGSHANKIKPWAFERATGQLVVTAGKTKYKVNNLKYNECFQGLVDWIEESKQHSHSHYQKPAKIVADAYICGKTAIVDLKSIQIQYT